MLFRENKSIGVSYPSNIQYNATSQILGLFLYAKFVQSMVSMALVKRLKKQRDLKVTVTIMLLFFIHQTRVLHVNILTTHTHNTRSYTDYRILMLYFVFDVIIR